MARVREQGGLYELVDQEGLDPTLVNDDIFPTPIADRHWNKWEIASLWVGMAVCIPTYMLASQMIIGGLSWLEALSLIVLGNLIVAVPMVFNGHAGTKYGIPFPVLGRASFGHLGIHVPSLLRAFVACGWFGIQTWLGGLAIVAIVAALTGSETMMDNWYAQFAGFIAFWFVNMYFVWKGTESIRFLETLAAPILIIIGVGMLAWGVTNAGGIGNILSSSYEFKKPTVELVSESGEVTAHLNLIKNSDGQLRADKLRYRVLAKEEASDSEKEEIKAMSWSPLSSSTVQLPGELTIGSSVGFQFGVGDFESSVVAATVVAERAAAGTTSLRKYLFWLTAMVAFWATLALNIPDITRFARSQRDQVAGQFIGLPTTMALYSFIGVAVTCAAIIIFDDILVTEDAPWDPIRLIARLDDQPVLLIFAQLSILLATLSTNIAANVISPANSFANLWPQKISFATGGIITGIVGIVIMPWKLLASIVGYLLTYGAVLGPVVGVLLADYFIIRKTELELEDLYRTDGQYAFWKGFNLIAMAALGIGVVIVLSGLWVDSMEVVYETGWFSGFFISFVIYIGLTKAMGPKS
jgi:cytosine/uracil/thiamine/allantoin permease